MTEVTKGTNEASDVDQVNLADEELEMRNMISKSIHEMFTIPANQLNLTQMFLETAIQAIKLQRQDEERRYARPVVVRAAYPDSIKGKVTSDGQGGFSVELEVEGEDGEWQTLTVDEATHTYLANTILTQSVMDGDVWYITNNATIEANLEKVANHYSGQLNGQ